MSPRIPFKHSSGFTMVELVVVIVILGILAAVAAPRFFDDRTFMQRGYFEELAAALKYAQKLAVASGCAVRVEIDEDGYEAKQQAEQNGSCNKASSSWNTGVALTDGGLLSGASPIGVEASPAVVVFNSLGSTDVASDQSISVGPFALTVRAGSGYVTAP